MTIHLILAYQMPVYQQLQLEEALLRLDDRNICLINIGSPLSIVMGISGKPNELIDLSKASHIPIIKRFSGGGTVVVDEDTLFVSFIFQKEMHSFPLFPEPIHRWALQFYRSALDHPDFMLRENDYTLGNLKCGGNAQYIRKTRFLHHSTFLWDYQQKYMDYLLLPNKRPNYRQDRPHHEFLCTLKEHFPSIETLKEKLTQELRKRFTVVPLEEKELTGLLEKEHRKSTSLYPFT